MALIAAIVIGFIVYVILSIKAIVTSRASIGFICFGVGGVLLAIAIPLIAVALS